MTLNDFAAMVVKKFPGTCVSGDFNDGDNIHISYGSGKLLLRKSYAATRTSEAMSDIANFVIANEKTSPWNTVSSGSTLNFTGDLTIGNGSNLGSALADPYRQRPTNQYQQRLANEEQQRLYMQDRQIDYLIQQRQREMAQQVQSAQAIVRRQWTPAFDQQQYAERPATDNVTWLSYEVGRITDSGRNELAP